MSYKTCPNCDKKLDGLLSSRFILQDSTIAFINGISDIPKEAYCDECGLAILNNYTLKIRKEREVLIQELKDKLDIIPILTIPNPANWNYEPITMISAQTVTGTGFLSEISASWADMLGSQSGALSNKLMNGENLCKDRLRFDALLLGGNAIIGTDIDYSEVGGAKGMLMVCMAGTAVKVTSWSDNFGANKVLIEELFNKAARLTEINQTKIPKI